MKRFVILLVLGLPAAGTGCTPLQDASIAVCNRVSAEHAWWSSSKHYRRSEMSIFVRQHFRHGYVQGYYDVSRGSCGEVPLFPPKCYWGAKYQTAQGTEYINAWFRGYQEGAVAALNDGALGSNRLPTSWSPAHVVPHPGLVPETGNPFPEPIPTGPSEILPVPPEAGPQIQPPTPRLESNRRSASEADAPPTALPRRVDEPTRPQTEPARPVVEPAKPKTKSKRSETKPASPSAKDSPPASGVRKGDASTLNRPTEVYPERPSSEPSTPGLLPGADPMRPPMVTDTDAARNEPAIAVTAAIDDGSPSGEKPGSVVQLMFERPPIYEAPALGPKPPIVRPLFGPPPLSGPN
jgi:hypothetical protein